MKTVVQRVLCSSVYVQNQKTAEIDKGLLVLVGVAQEDRAEDAEYLANKIAGLRIFADPPGKMNLSVSEIRGAVLAVPQFTLLGDCRKGRRPDFTRAAAPEKGMVLYEHFCQSLETLGLPVKKGSFQEHMHVSLVNDGPVTILLDSKKQNTELTSDY